MPTATKPKPGLERVAINPQHVLADHDVRRQVRRCLNVNIPPADVAAIIGCCAADLPGVTS